ncbi:MAG: SPOR domain-containing protein [Sphingobium sp.]
MRAALVGTIVATCAASMAAPASADVKAGVDAWQQGDYARAIAEWRPMAATGDPDAQFNLGQAYKLGRGVPVDMPVAIDWFRKASAQGHVRAADNLGLLMFQQGRREEAIPFIRKSAERGEPRAQYILGTAMFNGDLVAKDWVMAYALMTRAAASGLEQATTSLATMDRYIATDQRQKGLALAADMSRTKAPDYAAAPAASNDMKEPARSAAATTPAREKPAAEKPPVGKPAPVPPRQIASAQPSRPPERIDDGPPERQSRPGATYDRPPERDVLPTRAAVPPPTPRTTAKPPTSVAQAPPSVARPARPPGGAPPPTTVPGVRSPASGNWRIQMGAFREEPRAKALWREATSKVSGLSGYKLSLVKGGDVTRVQAGPLQSEADAARLCGKLRAAGYSCIPRSD